MVEKLLKPHLAEIQDFGVEILAILGEDEGYVELAVKPLRNIGFSEFFDLIDFLEEILNCHVELVFVP